MGGLHWDSCADQSPRRPEDASPESPPPEKELRPVTTRFVTAYPYLDGVAEQFGGDLLDGVWPARTKTASFVGLFCFGGPDAAFGLLPLLP